MQCIVERNKQSFLSFSRSLTQDLQLAEFSVRRTKHQIEHPTLFNSVRQAYNVKYKNI